MKPNQIVTNETNTSNNPSPSSNSNLTSNSSNLPNTTAADGEPGFGTGSLEYENVMSSDDEDGMATLAAASHKTDECGGPSASAVAATAVGDVVTSSTGSPHPVVEVEPEFEYKEALREVTFNKTPSVKNGFETSGLCSIM